MMDLQALTQQVIKICKDADNQIISQHQADRDISVKNKDASGRNFVTQVDLETEDFLKQKLHRLLPQAGIIAEEQNGNTSNDTLNWIIDPIDGTTNFIHGLPPYCISVALYDSKRPLIGVVYELFSKECFYAWAEGGAWCNGNRLQVNPTRDLQGALLCTGFPYDQSDTERFTAWIAIFSNLLQSTRAVRRLGAAAVDLAYVAAGRLDGFYEYDLQAWDVAAGVCIIQEAGGFVSDFKGENAYLLSGEIIASTNPILHHKLLAEIRKEGF